MRPPQIHQQRRCQRNFPVSQFFIGIFYLRHAFFRLFILLNQQGNRQKHFLRQLGDPVVVFAQITLNQQIDAGIIIHQIIRRFNKGSGFDQFFRRIFRLPFPVITTVRPHLLQKDRIIVQTVITMIAVPCQSRLLIQIKQFQSPRNVFPIRIFHTGQIQRRQNQKIHHFLAADTLLDIIVHRVQQRRNIQLKPGRGSGNHGRHFFIIIRLPPSVSFNYLNIRHNLSPFIFP